MTIVRLPNWASRLAALISEAEARPFNARHWNCAIFAMAAVEAVIGEKPRVRIQRGLLAMADSAGFPRITPLQARTGDIAFVANPDRFGVVLDGGRVAFVGPRGLVRYPITNCAAAWRIGQWR